jgi:Domain of unknown function (DUF4129)
MEPLGPGQRRAFRLWTVLLSLLALLAVIAYSSRSGFGHTTKARPTPGYVDWAVSIFLVVFVLMIPFAVYSYWMQMREWRAKQESKSFQSRVLRGFGIVAFVMAIGLGIAILHKHGFNIVGLRHLFDPRNAAGKNAHGKLASGPYDPKFRWPVVWATIVLLAAVAAYVLWRRNRAKPLELGSGEEETVAEAVAASIDGALDDLEREPDARRAVIAAYARMEGVLGRHGLQRKQSETALEYLQRALLGLTSRREAVTRLTALFERAKFSRHEIDGAMKQEAIDSLRTIRDDLRPVEA